MPRTNVVKRRRSAGPRKPGRPAAQASDDVRAALLSAARSLFLKHGFANVSSRQIATAAHTTPAMIHYYFTDKHGLFREIVGQALEPFFVQLASAFASESSTVGPEQLITMHMRTGAANAWLGSLLANEVFAEGGALRNDFVRDFGQRLAPMLIRVLEAARERGVLRRDVDMTLAALSFVSLCAFPLLSRAVTGPVLGIRLDGPDLDRMVEHTVNVFMRGCGA